MNKKPLHWTTGYQYVVISIFQQCDIFLSFVRTEKVQSRLLGKEEILGLLLKYRAMNRCVGTVLFLMLNNCILSLRGNCQINMLEVIRLSGDISMSFRCLSPAIDKWRLTFCTVCRILFAHLLWLYIPSYLAGASLNPKFTGHNLQTVELYQNHGNHAYLNSSANHRPHCCFARSKSWRKSTLVF